MGKAVRTGNTGFWSGTILGFLTVLSLMAAPLASAQDLGRKITIHVDNHPVSMVLDLIHQQYGINFSYNSAMVPVNRSVTLHVEQKPLEKVLRLLLKAQGIEYQWIENQWVLKPEKGKGQVDNNPAMAGQGKATISGFVYDATNREALIGATVMVAGLCQGVVTNGYGFFSLTLKKGTYVLVFSYLGFKPLEKEIILDRNTRVSLDLQEDNREMNEVEIIAAVGEQNESERRISENILSVKAMGKLPGFGGNVDVIRALQTLPGIQTFGDGSSRYFVRGGNSDQNLLLIDEVPVYNPSHLFGFFSAFSPDAINHVRIYKGDFPAKYGGRLSSVVDIRARDGNMKKFGVAANIGPYTSGLTLEGPILKDKSSFLVSGRVSTLNWLSNLNYFKNNFGFQFFDINAKLNLMPNATNRFYLTFYYGRDEFSRYNSVEINSYGIEWDNLAIAGRWYHVFNHRFFSNTTLSYGQYRYSLNLPQETNGYWRSSISNLTLKTDLTAYLNPANTLRGGIQISSHRSDPGNVTTSDVGSANIIPVVSPYYCMEYVGYLSDEQRIGKKWSLNYGIRLPVWQDMGPASVYFFDVNHQVIDTVTFGANEVYSTTFSPEPRVNVQWRATSEMSLRTGYSRNTQFMQLLSNSISPFNSLEVWAPCGPNVLPQVVDQITVGFSNEQENKSWSISMEGYYKWYHDRLDYRDHPNLLFNTLIEGELRFGKGYSYGLETMLRKQTGRVNGWIGYTWSRALILTPGYNRDEYYPADYDRPHSLSINLSYDDHKHWLLAANWIFMSGNPYSMPVGFIKINGYTVPVYGERNNARLPDYHRLDLMASYTLSKPGSRLMHRVSLTLYNAYARKNPFSLNFNKMENQEGQYVVPSNLFVTNVLIPTWFSVAGIIPSINYLLKF